MSSAKPTIKDILVSAEQAERTGDPARAVAIYSSILAKFPKHFKAKTALKRLQKSAGGGGNRMTQVDANQLGQLLNQGAFEQVLERISLLLVHNRKEPFIYNIQGLAHSQLNHAAAAVTSFKHALKLNPNFVEVYNNLGMALITGNRPQEALVPLQKAIALRATYPEAHHNLGVALAALGRGAEALEAYDRAITLKRDYANAYNSRGALHKSMDAPQLAIADLRKALEFFPDDAEACSNLSGVYAIIGDSTAAVHFGQRAVELRPENVSFRHSLAILLNGLGENGQAREQLIALLEVEPNHADALRVLATIENPAPDAPLALKIKTLLDLDATPAADKVQLGFALAKMNEDIGAFEAGFTYLKQANDTNFGLLDYDVSQENAAFDRLKHAYTEKSVAARAGTGNPTQTPILIVGLMRSGTSLVEQILASHSQVWGAGELMAATRLLDTLGIEQDFPTERQVQEFGQQYLKDLTVNSEGKPRVTDKMPGNFRHIGMMKLAFPNIKIINMVRDPRDNCYSIYKNFFDTQAHQYAYHLEYLANFANQYKSLMAHWDTLFPGQIYDCNYEALTANQEEESRKLLAYCGLEWEPQVLEFYKTKRVVRTASVNQVRQKIYKTSVRSWERVSDGLAPLIDGLDTELWSDYL